MSDQTTGDSLGAEICLLRWKCLVLGFLGLGGCAVPMETRNEPTLPHAHCYNRVPREEWRKKCRGPWDREEGRYMHVYEPGSAVNYQIDQALPAVTKEMLYRMKASLEQPSRFPPLATEREILERSLVKRGVEALCGPSGLVRNGHEFRCKGQQDNPYFEVWRIMGDFAVAVRLEKDPMIGHIKESIMVNDQ